MKKRTLFKTAALSLILSSSAAFANDFPSRQMTLVVPFAAGGGVDLMARYYAKKLGDQLKQTVIVENRGGAGGTIGSAPVPTRMNHLPTLWHLRVFDCVAQLENVTKASQVLLRTQPAITLCIGSLEKMLGVALFERTKTSVHLTEVGISAHVRVKKILESLEQGIAAITSDTKLPPLVIAARITRSQMQALLAIHECHSFRTAAAKLNISDSSLQRSARTLEAHLGCKLYKNTAAGIKTSQQGDELALCFKNALAQITALVESVQQFNYPKEKSVNVGVMVMDPSILVVNAIKETQQTFPDARVAVINGTHENLTQKLLREEIDFIIGLLKEDQQHLGLQHEFLYRESYCIVARRGHPLSQQPQLTIEDLNRYPWILPPASSPRRRAYEHVFVESSPPPALIETYSLSTIRITLAESDILTVLSWMEVLSERHFGLLAPLDFNIDYQGLSVGITTAQGKTLTDLQAFFLNAFRKNAHCLARS